MEGALISSSGDFMQNIAQKLAGLACFEIAGCDRRGGVF